MTWHDISYELSPTCNRNLGKIADASKVSRIKRRGGNGMMMFAQNINIFRWISVSFKIFIKSVRSECPCFGSFTRLRNTSNVLVLSFLEKKRRKGFVRQINRMMQVKANFLIEHCWNTKATGYLICLETTESLIIFPCGIWKFFSAKNSFAINQIFGVHDMKSN